MLVRSWINLACLTAVLALGAWLWLAPREAPPREYRLSSLESSQVDRIRVARVGLLPIELQRKGERWRITAPITARAAPIKVSQMLELLAARSRERLEAERLERYDLAPPPLTVTLGSQSFGFGMVNPVTHQQYVLVGDAVYLIPPRYAAAFPLTVDDVLTRNLLAPDERPVAIELPHVRATLRDGRWHVEPAIDGISQDDVNRWLDRWRHAIAAATEVVDGNTQTGERAAFRLADGRTVELTIERREPELTLVRRDEGLRFRFPAEVGRRMLARPDSS